MRENKERELEDRLLEDILQYAISEELEQEMQEFMQKETESFEPSQEFLDNMEEIFKKEERKEYWKKNRMKFTKMAAGVAIAVVCVSATIMNVEAFRVPIFNLFIEVQDKFSRINRQEEGKDKIPHELEYLSKEFPELALPTEVPEGFAHVETKGIDENYITQYERNSTEKFTINQFKSDGNVVMNTEREEGKIIQYKNQEYTIKVDDDKITLIWEKNKYSFTLSGNLSKHQALSVAESLYFGEK